MSGLRRATIKDLAAVTSLQQEAYARNRVLLGVAPLPLAADCAESSQPMKSFSLLAGNIAWYRRHGYVRERVEEMHDRRPVHLVKHLGSSKGRPVWRED